MELTEIRKPLLRAISTERGRLWVCERLFNVGAYIAVHKEMMAAWAGAHCGPDAPPDWLKH